MKRVFVITLSIIVALCGCTLEDGTLKMNEDKSDETIDYHVDWSPEWMGLMDGINKEHKNILKKEVSYKNFFEDREVNNVDISSSSIMNGFSLEKAEIDIDYLFMNLKKNYGLYNYLGGDSNFNTIKLKIKEECGSIENLTEEQFQEILIKNFSSFIQDLHFSINGKRVTKQKIPFFYTEEEFIKLDNKYQTIDGREIQSIDNFNNIENLFHRSLTQDGDVVYYPVIYLELDGNNQSQKPKDLVIHYTNGESQIIHPEDYRKMPKEDFVLDISEKNGIDIVKLNRFGFDEGGDKDAQKFLECANTLKNKNVCIVDLRTNGGGNGVLPYKWFYEYTGKMVPSNFYTLSLINQKDMESQVDSPYYISNESISNLINPLDIECGSISDTKDDEYIENNTLMVVLTSKRTASAAELFVDLAHNVENVLTIGEPTAGAFRGDSSGVGIKLPYSGLNVIYGSSQHVLPEGYFDEGRGFEPDLWCPAVYAEEAALNLLEQLK